ncbi:MAG: hypothetical protein MZU95_00225 [Desulfomicrobium escambiense]|nr:hypothetical protein [Desulfomicrobium escambiense]
MRPYYSLPGLQEPGDPAFLPERGGPAAGAAAAGWATATPWASTSWRRSASSGTPTCPTRRPRPCPRAISSAWSWRAAWP